MKAWVLTLAIAYLLGSVPFGYLLVRFFRKEDIRATGSGNIGATNVARSGAKGLGILTLLLDCAKGYAAVVIAFYVAQHTAGFLSADPKFASEQTMSLACAAALTAMLGHVFPVWLGFKGGKGVATALGVYLALCWPAALGALGVFLLIAVITRYISLASILGAAVLPVLFLLFRPERSPMVVSCVLFSALLVILKHHANIARLKSGTESKFGSNKTQVNA